MLLFQRVRDVLLWSSTRTYELHVSMTATLSGLWILHPATDIDQAPAWAPIIRILGGQGHLGVLLVALGIAAMFGLVENHIEVRRHVQFGLFLVFIGVAMSAWSAGSMSPAPVVYLTLGMTSAWTSIRLAVIRE